MTIEIIEMKDKLDSNHIISSKASRLCRNVGEMDGRRNIKKPSPPELQNKTQEQKWLERVVCICGASLT